MDITGLLTPKSVAVVGASSNKKKLGRQILDNLASGEYKGEVFPVNVKEKSIRGMRTYKSVKDIEREVDMAVVAIPAAAVAEVLRECGEKNIKNVVLISAGFSESGRKGKKKGAEIRRVAKRYGINILGPNCLGVINNNIGLNATFAYGGKTGTRRRGPKNKVAFISQSGAIGSSILDWTRGKRFGLSYFVSLGNKAGVDENDLLEYFIRDSKTETVAVYLEEIADGKRFMRAVSRLASVKPVIVLKAGLTDTGSRASLSHTGSMAGSKEAVLTGLRRSGAIVVSSLQEFFDLVEIFGKKKEAEAENICIVSNAGGPLVVTADQMEEKGLSLAEFPISVKKELEDILPSSAAPEDPLDIIGDADADRYKKSLEAILKERKLDSVLVLLTPQTTTQPKRTAQVIARLSKEYPDKLILASFVGGESVKEAKEILDNSSAIHYEYPVRAIQSLYQLREWRRIRERLIPYTYSSEAIPKKSGQHKDHMESLRLLEEFDIPVVETRVIEKERDLARLSYPAVLKVTGPHVIHKTDEHFIALNISDRGEAKKVWKEFQGNMGKEDYCVAQPMVKGAVEIVVGFRRDNKFGPIVMVGAGGIYTEILRDIQTETDDVTPGRAKEMIKKLRIFPVLRGARGGDKYDVDALARVVVNIAKLSGSHPQIRELDINPLFVTRNGVWASDVRIIE